MVELDISFCGLRKIPDAIGCLRWLERLDLGGNNFVTLPSLRELSRLVYLDLEHCKLLESLPQLPFPIAFEHGFHKYKYWMRIGLIIFNCPKLGESELYSRTAFSWMIQLIQARQQSVAAFFDVINIVIPESEIPNWFNNQSVSGSIPIELYPFVHDIDDNIIGIACCAVFSIAPVDPTRATNARRPEIELYISNSKTHLRYAIIPVILERRLIEVKSDHICLIYFPL
jgi:Leucine-rich repeat (LRR) protein